jgi:hypothetical protein
MVYTINMQKKFLIHILGIKPIYKYFDYYSRNSRGEYRLSEWWLGEHIKQHF